MSRQTKPPLGAQINYGHPLANGLVDCWLLGESSNAQTVNQKTGKVSTSGSVPPARGSIDGMARVFNGATSSRSLDNTVQALPDGTDYTVWARCIPTVGGVLQSPLDSDDQAGVRMFQLRFNASNQFEFVAFNTAISAFTATSSTTMQLNRVASIAGSVRGTAVSVWANGLNAGSATLTGTLESSASIIMIGRRLTGAGPQQFTGNILVAARWNRALTEREHFLLHHDPYVLFRAQSPAMNILSPIGGGGGGGYNSNMLLLGVRRLLTVYELIRLREPMTRRQLGKVITSLVRWRP